MYGRTEIGDGLEAKNEPSLWTQIADAPYSAAFTASLAFIIPLTTILRLGAIFLSYLIISNLKQQGSYGFNDSYVSSREGNGYRFNSSRTLFGL